MPDSRMILETDRALKLRDAVRLRGLMTRGWILLSVITGILYTSTLTASNVEHGAPRHVAVTAKRFAFQPAEITLKKGEPVDLALQSTDVAHGVRISELNIDVKVNKGATADVKFTPSKTGDFIGHCSVFCGSGHGSMTLTIHVVD